MKYPSIEPGMGLLVLADFCEFYFHSLYYVPAYAAVQEPVSYRGKPHIGMFQDSYLISTGDYSVDIRYFPHFRNIEFYSENTARLPFYLENIGEVTLYARTSAGTIKLDPGERRQVLPENAEPEAPVLPGGDLYPAEIL